VDTKAAVLKEKTDKWNLVQKSRSIMDRAEKDGKRSLTTEERSELDTMSGVIDKHDSRIGDLEKYNRDSEENPTEGGEPDPVTSEADDTGRSHRQSGDGRNVRTEARHLRAYSSRRVRSMAIASNEYRNEYRNYLATGQTGRVQSMLQGDRRTAVDVIIGTQSQGGYLVAPIEVSKDIVKQTDNLVFVRQLARIYTVTNTQAIGVRQMTVRADDSDWTTEIAAVTQDTSLAFGRRDLTPTILTKLIKESIRIFESGVDVDDIITEELAYKQGVTQEKAFLLGTGSGQPLGVFVASASGIPTSQDFTSGATADFVADDLIGMKYNLKQTYFTDKTKCRWVMGRPIVKEVRTFKDQYGQYLWRPGLAGGDPDTILDIPLAISEYAPTVKTTGSYIAVLGNFNYYGIAQLRDYYIQRLVELYAGTNEIGFISRNFVDGAPLLGEAFTRLKTA
jgi:HK97 family phage major capsid protein